MAQQGPVLEGRGRTDYERYIRTEELLSLQKDESKLVHPEERLFQITHQAAELWLKQLDFEIDRIAGSMRTADSSRRATFSSVAGGSSTCSAIRS